MTTITSSNSTTTPTTAARSIWRTAGIAGAVAAVATTVIGGIAKATDVPLVLGELEVQVPAFAIFTLVGAALGAIIATQLQKRSAQPRRTFLITPSCSPRCQSSPTSPLTPRPQPSSRSSARTSSPPP